MLFLKGHGRHVVPDGTHSAPNYPAHTCVSEACGFAPEELVPSVANNTGPFGCYFENAKVP